MNYSIHQRYNNHIANRNAQLLTKSLRVSVMHEQNPDETRLRFTLVVTQVRYREFDVSNWNDETKTKNIQYKHTHIEHPMPVISIDGERCLSKINAYICSVL
jgi:hypothetical protein